ncbi:MAG: PorP/SprF family type IX secretion system membrane protein, partial [Crocinitomix sp.]|nr:PorP/SprF family type IX secretion system membrane protein [Crocinitomix sp.]
MKKITTILIALCSFHGFSQDPEFTQFYANPIYLNPAMAGTHGCPRLNMNYRNQWANISGAFVTNSVSYDQFVNVLQGGVALMVTNDMAGKNTLNWSTINLAYSYHLQVTRKFTLLFGAQATWNQKFLDWSKLTFGDQIDP